MNRGRADRRRPGERGSALILVYSTAAALIVAALAVSARALTEWRVAQMHAWRTEALYAAEAGIDQAIAELRDDYAWTAGFDQAPFGDAGEYSVTVASSGSQRTLASAGRVTASGGTVERTVEAVVRSALPPNFFDQAIYSSATVTLNGNAYQVTGNVLSGNVDSAIQNTSHISGQITYDATAHPLPALQYEPLYELAAAQNNVYDAARLQQVTNGTDHFPASFWRTPPSDPGDPSTGVPNIVYVTTDLQLNGNIGTIGGFFVVVGNVLTDPNAEEDVTINGQGTVDGPVYTRGQFRINGGGGQLNVQGGVWAGTEARLNGNAAVTYNADYMAALSGLLASDVQVILWREGA